MWLSTQGQRKREKNCRESEEAGFQSKKEDYESPQIDLAKSRCSTPCNAPTVNDITDKDRPIADLMNIVTSKFNEVLDAIARSTG